ncbi:hypothetical protein SAMN05880582_102109 [Rhizobium sp. RU20A]|uniref:hypothetical protein n=1 Tax=Rhizobium sp. RU20A TaxID=1907412 RepID=UPI000955A499|nr:hypothetical protein [Rhizobium sp. RU20A]SIQ55082.1 hypothetical protein SAMN05880582_102109 [Rhizobium sp. RU20A]
MDVDVSSDLRIRNVLGRLEMILDNETSRIGVDPTFDIKTSNAHKSRCLYELSMLQRKANPADLPKSFEERTRSIQRKLEDNAIRIEAHMEAVRSVVDILKTAMHDADADGIYTPEQFRYSEAG